jgi:predicted peroxiredoxin
MSEKKERLMFVVTCAEERPDKATIPFVLANAALAMDTEVIVVLQIMGVYLGMKNYARHVQAAGFPPLQDLIETLQEGGGRIWVCEPCIKSRQISVDELIEGAEVVAGATVIDGVLDSRNVMVY